MTQEGSKAHLQEVVDYLEKEEDVKLENFKHKDPEGVGDSLERAFAKFGVTEETVEKFSGIGGCGCQKVKKFLNQIFPYRKKDESAAEEPPQENSGGGGSGGGAK
jgi:hypothetical protein